MSGLRRWGGLVVAVLALAVCVVAVQQAWSLRNEATRSRVLVDRELTREVTDAVATSVERLWSYDYRHLERLDQVLPDVGTASFRRDYAPAYREVRRLAPQRRAVVTATVNEAAVSTLTRTRAVLLVFVNQRMGGGGAAGARLRVEAVLSDGEWKISGITPL